MQRLLQPLSRTNYGLSYSNGVRKAKIALDEEPAEEKGSSDAGTTQYYDPNSRFGVITLSPNPISLQGGLWLELTNTGPMQLIEAVICSKNSKVLVSKSFVLPQGKSSFFWSLDNIFWPSGTYELLIRSEKQLIRRKLSK
ncbi:hypothetical protein D770_13220 [Flammeovirgaceae bacterium 311]|nr:hypothetical protein D770_13220 [Flammeovirgaceae bacterium 311]